MFIKKMMIELNYDEVGKKWTGEELVLHSFLPAWEMDKDHRLTKTCRSAFKDIKGQEPKK